MMLDNKQIKLELKKKAFREPEKYYPTDALKELGYIKNQCKTCSRLFYAIGQKDVCGDPACYGGFKFIGNTPAKNNLDYIQAWKTFAKLMEKQGYTPINRYPCVARWREDEYWVAASIYDFQPYVVSGEVEPPANPLVVPQFCLRFNDIDNVGITGAHYTGFIMQGQHAFVDAKNYDKNKYLKDLHNWFTQGIGIPKEELYIHLDSWAGGGNAGISCEFMCRGLEIANQVYMQYEATHAGLKDLKIKVLDMGQGQERVAWFSNGTSTSYETTFPTVAKKLYEITGVKADNDLMKRFLPYSSYLNVDEVEDIEKVWEFVAEKVGEDTDVLKNKILPLAAIYSIGEHTRSLLFALNDGALPSNVGGGYNLRVILRRALSFIEKYNWHIDLPKIAEMHAAYLKPLFPELSENLNEVTEILEVEKNKYANTKQKSRQIVDKIFADAEAKNIQVSKIVDDAKLIELYDSNGISPELIREEASKLGERVNVPADFYAKVAKLHQERKQVQENETEKKIQLDLTGVSETKALYFDDYKKTSFKAKVVKIIGNYIILDQTYFYPTSGGQVHDTGKISGSNAGIKDRKNNSNSTNNQNIAKIVDVFKQGNVVVHALEDETAAKKFKAGTEINCEIDSVRRIQLSQHHTATHIVNSAARKVLGNHINQGGAKKTPEKAHIDITHYQSLTEKELEEIEKEANKIVSLGIATKLSFYKRNDAEKSFGMAIYQGGAVPGNLLRIVEIPGVDVECCGGTHLHNTKEAGKIVITGSTKISDGIVRITFTAGNASAAVESKDHQILVDTATLAGTATAELPDYAAKLFENWKKAKKLAVRFNDEAYVLKVKSGEIKFDINELEITDLKKEKLSEPDILLRTSAILKTQPEHMGKTIARFKKELEDWKKDIKNKF